KIIQKMVFAKRKEQEASMEQYDLAGCSVIIPVMVDTPQRVKHLNFILRYFQRFFKNQEMIVVEQGKEPKVQISKSRQVKLEFVKSEEPFSLSKICNIGVSLAQTPFFCKCDVDTFTFPK